MPDQKRLLITGARAWEDRDRLYAVLDEALRQAGGNLLLVSGHCPTGADRMGEDWAVSRGVPLELHPADWNRHGKSAGYKRNQEMVELGADGVVAFIAGESRGTRHTIDLAERAGLRLTVVSDEEDAPNVTPAPVPASVAEPAAISFVAIDFETANAKRASACSVGLARIEHGVVVETDEWFITPPDGGRFTNTHIHGIHPHQVVGAPTWADTLERIDGFSRGLELVAYGNFDKSVYNAATELLGIDHPGYLWWDAVRLCQRLYDKAEHGLPNHKLPSMAAHFGLGAFDHHNAGADAAIAGEIVIRVAAEHGANTCSELWGGSDSKVRLPRRFAHA